MRKFRLKLPFIGLAISWMLMLLIATPVFASGGGDLSGNISSGSLTVANVGSPTLSQSLSLDGKDATITIKIPLAVINAVGDGAGWTMYVDAGQFSTQNAALHVLTSPVKVNVKDTGTPPVGITLPNSTSGLGCDVLSTCALPDTLTSNGTTVPVESPLSWNSDLSKVVYTTAGYSGATLFTASTGNGMGTMYLEADFSISVPANEVVIYGGSTTYTATFAMTFGDTPV